MALQRIPINEIDKIETIEIKGGCSPSYIQNKYQPSILMNGVLFDNYSKSLITNVKTRNTGKQGYLFYEHGMGIRDNKPIWISKWDALKDDSVTDFIGSAPSIIINGKIDIQKKDITSSFYGTTTYRSGIGFNDKELVLFSGDTMYGFSGYSKYIDSLGLDYFLNVDGGGSCYLSKYGKKLHSQYDGRSIPHWILIYFKKPTQIEEGEEVVTKTKIVLNNKEKEVDAILKDGHNYIALKDLVDGTIQVTYDAAKKMPVVSVKK